LGTLTALDDIDSCVRDIISISLYKILYLPWSSQRGRNLWNLAFVYYSQVQSWLDPFYPDLVLSWIFEYLYGRLLSFR